MNKTSHLFFWSLIVFLFFFRLFYGLSSEFWFDDELQIYLIGLKSYTMSAWPYYGPDLVYTQTQIAGALQGLLVSLPFYVFKIPESPTIFLNILSFIGFATLAFYVSKRITEIPAWLIWAILMTTPWAMNYSTRVVNPSYVVVFSSFFFIALFEALPIYKEPLLKKEWAFFLMGLCTTLAMQLHMSWVLLPVFSALAFWFQLKKPLKYFFVFVGLYFLGLFLGSLTLLPTFFLSDAMQQSSNIVFHIDNWKNLFIIFIRFLAFASNEIPYMLGGSTEQRLAVFYDQLWMSPALLFLLILGFLQVGFFIFMFFVKNISLEFKKIKWLVLFSIVLLYASFFFSVKGPSSHTFFILFPLAMFYAFYCYAWLMSKKKFAKPLLVYMFLASIVFHVGFGIYNFKNKSLYKNRENVVQALEQMDYKIVGQRRADIWGHGF